MGKSADDLVGFKYPAGGGNDIGVYKQPMNNPNPQGDVHIKGNQTDRINMSVGNTGKNQSDAEHKADPVKYSFM